MFFSTKGNPDLEKIATILRDSIVKMFVDYANINISIDAEMNRKNIVDFRDHHMRADGIEKFNSPSCVGFINYYLNKKNLDAHDPVGAIVVYVENSYISPLMKLLKYPPLDEEDDEALLDGVGTICNILAGSFKLEMSVNGYADLEMSAFQTHRNSALTGVKFNPKEFFMYELVFYIKKEKRIVLEFTMGMVPKK
ncbi:MAG: hypothetical protein KAJ18_11040 [Candidatus Omnitrophica bacterium]|nr:hypothetical protein [Candidatus Omnitrophota bacterium]